MFNYFRVSELRVVELLDGICEKMQDYTLEKVILHFSTSIFLYKVANDSLNLKIYW